MKDASKIGIALLAGIAAGALAGILLAPEEGQETRKKLAKKARKLEEKLKDKANDLKDKAKDFKGKAEGYMSKANDFKDEAVKTAEGYL